MLRPELEKEKSSGLNQPLKQEPITNEGEKDYITGNQLYMACQYQKALPYFEKSAEKKYPAAYLRLFTFYEDGLGVSVDKLKSDLWCQKVIENTEWFKMQAEKGLADAQFNLGFCYQYVNKLVNNSDLRKEELIVNYYELAADQGHVIAQFHLGKYFVILSKSLTGTYDTALKYRYTVMQAYTLAMKYYQLAADQGHVASAYWVGDCLTTGINFKRDAILAAKYHRIAADQGLAASQYYTGQNYECGYGVAIDKKVATYYYQLAASQGDKYAKDALAKDEMKKYFKKCSKNPNKFFNSLPSNVKGSETCESYIQKATFTKSSGKK